MSKRKRHDDTTDNSVDFPSDFRRHRQIVHSFEESANQLARAFKLAKGFERQKLGRRKKQATANNKKNDSEYHSKDVERIDSEVAALKTLDPLIVAEQYLAKLLLKIKAVSATDSTIVPESIQKSWIAKAGAASSTSNTHTLNITARLCNSKPVKEAFPTVWTGLTGDLGVDDGGEGNIGTGRKKRLRASDYAGRDENNGRNVEELGSKQRKESDNGTLKDSGDEEEDEEFMGFEDRLASSEDSDSANDEDVDVDELELQLEQEGVSRKAKYDFVADLSLSEDASDTETSTSEPSRIAAPKRSAFLPSLTMGGYISGSGSDMDDDDLNDAPRKNRRGQRARQKIWEQKFGTRAKHLQTSNQKQGWDPKRGATDGRRGGRNTVARGGRQTGKKSNEESATGANAFAVQKTRRDDTGSLHPSWEAAKRAKEKKNSIPAFQGKKISFD